MSIAREHIMIVVLYLYLYICYTKILRTVYSYAQNAWIGALFFFNQSCYIKPKYPRSSIVHSPQMSLKFTIICLILKPLSFDFLKPLSFDFSNNTYMEYMQQILLLYKGHQYIYDRLSSRSWASWSGFNLLLDEGNNLPQIVSRILMTLRLTQDYFSRGYHFISMK